MSQSALSGRSLALIKRSGSTSRILNLHDIAERFGQTEEYREKPFFHSKRLNSSIILKHSLRGAEHYLFASPKPTATKILLPFANGELTIGGTNVFVGQKNFEGALRELGAYGDESALMQDIELLEHLDRLPSLDPFLLREQIKRINRDPARCYFQISDNDLKNMQEFVSEQIRRLIEMAFAGDDKTGNSAVSAQMAAKILADENADTLMPLKAALGLDGTEWADGVFCWKGFLYYKWSFRNLVPQSAALIKQMRGLGLGRCDVTRVASIRQMMERAQTLLKEKVQSINSLLRIYDIAYNTLTTEKNPAAFKDFLLQSPKMFVEIGESAGVAGHLVGFWSYRFKDATTTFLTAPELVEIFQEFENCRTANGEAQATQLVWAS
ncbi:MAG: hypothetical protein GC190_09590 [Alphaproteobacteria bacterium]|nr:hypothetical protein [Alphaproteobacteria bacterium]